ncbi:UNVERIFIED_CONTAM: hypothetical protein FKN15_056918 [Acipenser sinensis]
MDDEDIIQYKQWTHGAQTKPRTSQTLLEFISITCATVDKAAQHHFAKAQAAYLKDLNISLPYMVTSGLLEESFFLITTVYQGLTLLILNKLVKTAKTEFVILKNGICPLRMENQEYNTLHEYFKCSGTVLELAFIFKTARLWL